MKRFVRVLVVWLLAAIFVAGLSVNVDATTDNVCPEGDGWVKADGLSGLTYTFTPPDGFTVTDNCMKVGDHPPLFGTGPTVTNTTLFNSPGGAVCTAPGVPVAGCALQGISHASFFLVPVTTTTGTTPTTQADAPPTTQADAPPTTQADTPTTLTSTTLIGNPTTLPGVPTTTIGVAPTIISVPGNPTTSLVLATPSPEDTLPFTGLVENAEVLAALAALLGLAGVAALSWKGRDD